ncbi:MAG: glucose-1-phosphate adenylyltransferase subunit GlgD [Clostridiales bacterium]|nr:glucose-1-phosphate adenylyltransferase subunit GlgD [Clostridiales bacterium]
MKTLGIVFSNIHDKEITELTQKRTLASIPFGGRYRLIDFVLSNMVNSGIGKVGIITKTNYQSLMDHVGSGKYWDLSRKNGGLMLLPPYGVGDRVLYKSRFEAICGISHFLRRCDEEYVVMSDCDAVCNCDFSDALQYHIDHDAEMTVIVHKTKTKGHSFTSVAFDKNHRVTSVTNQDKQDGEKYILTNMIIVNRLFLLKLIENAHELGYTSFSRDILVRGAKEYRIFAYEYDGYFRVIDSLANYYAYSLELLDKNTRDDLFKKDGANIYTKVRDSAPCRITDTAKVHNSLVADGCVIEGEVSGSILFRGVKVAKGAVITNSILFQDTEVGEGTKLNCVIADKQVKILEDRLLSGYKTHPYYISKDTVI